MNTEMHITNGNDKRTNFIVGLFGLLMLGLVATGCAPTYTDYSTFIQTPKPEVSSTIYRMEPPDVVLINSKRVREINGHTEMIGPDGRLTLPLIGPVYVAGMTTDELSELLTEKSESYYDDAEVTARVVGYNSKKIFVFGQVGAPGRYSYNGTNTILDLMAKAGPTAMADANRIQILRPNEDGELIRRMTVSINDMVKNGDISLNARLIEGDIVYVPPTPLAAVGLGLQQLLIPIQPAASTLTAPNELYEPISGRQAYGESQ